MNTYQEAEDALLLVSHMQRTILDNGVRQCFNALDNGGQTMDKYHAWTMNLHTGIVEECNLDEDNVIDMVELDPNDVDAAIEAEGWCGALGATYGFPFVICPIDTKTCPPEGAMFMRAALVTKDL